MIGDGWSVLRISPVHIRSHIGCHRRRFAIGQNGNAGSESYFRNQDFGPGSMLYHSYQVLIASIEVLVFLSLCNTHVPITSEHSVFELQPSRTACSHRVCGGGLLRSIY